MVSNPNKHFFFLPSNTALNSSGFKFYIRIVNIQRENMLCSNSFYIFRKYKLTSVNYSNFQYFIGQVIIMRIGAIDCFEGKRLKSLVGF